jgi:hypothetical protein
MSGTTDEPDGFDALDVATPEIDQTAFGKRLERAYRQGMTIVPEADADGECIGLYEVTTNSGSDYLVDLAVRGRCDCPDRDWNADESPACKHWLRVLLAVRHTALPAPGEEVNEAFLSQLLHEQFRLAEERQVAKRADDGMSTVWDKRFQAAYEGIQTLSETL